jgi:hypothetical protein
MQSGIAQKSRDDKILKGGGCGVMVGVDREEEGTGRGGCAHHSAGMDAADCIAEPVVLAESHCIVP